MTRDRQQGASADADRAVVNGAGQAVSALRVSVPSAVLDDLERALRAAYEKGFRDGQTAGTLTPFKYRGHHVEPRRGGEWVVQGTGASFKSLSSAKRWIDHRLAQAIEARRAETTGSACESAVSETDASDAALINDICDNMAEVLKPLPGEE